MALAGLGNYGSDSDSGDGGSPVTLKKAVPAGMSLVAYVAGQTPPNEGMTTASPKGCAIFDTAPKSGGQTLACTRRSYANLPLCILKA